MAEIFKLTHTRLGELTFNDDGWWEGEILLGNQELYVWVYGDREGVSPLLADDCIEVLEHFPTYFEKAVDILHMTCEELGIGKEIEFIPTHLCQFWRKDQDRGFSFYFKEISRPDLLWTVEFLNSEPKYAGCDT